MNDVLARPNNQQPNVRSKVANSQLPTPRLHVCEVPKKQGMEADTTLSNALTSEETKGNGSIRDLVGYFRDWRSTLPDNRRCARRVIGPRVALPTGVKVLFDR